MRFTDAFARLLSDGELRRRFAADPRGVAAEIGEALPEVERAALAALDPDALGAQARGLLEKRLHEVAALLPRTFAALGRDAARERFLAYAGRAPWPSGHLRHLDDALAFAAALRRAGATAVRASEVHRARFRRSGRRVALHVVWEGGVGVQLLWRAGDGGRREAWVGLGKGPA